MSGQAWSVKYIKACVSHDFPIEQQSMPYNAAIQSGSLAVVPRPDIGTCSDQTNQYSMEGIAMIYLDQRPGCAAV